jgi:hypothetical protein
MSKSNAAVRANRRDQIIQELSSRIRPLHPEMHERSFSQMIEGMADQKLIYERYGNEP